MKQIEVFIQPQYGRWVYYPVCEEAKAFAEIAGTKTLTEATLAQIKRMGYEIKATAQSMDALLQGMLK